MIYGQPFSTFSNQVAHGVPAVSWNTAEMEEAVDLAARSANDRIGGAALPPMPNMDGS